MHERPPTSQHIPVEQGWRENVLQDLEVLTLLPSEYVHNGPVFEAQTKSGQVLRCENYILNLQECSDAGWGHVVENAFIRGERSFLVAKDEFGGVVGTRIANLIHQKKFGIKPERIIVKANIKIILKGQGLARPVEEGFVKFLQYYADSKQLLVEWMIENKNAHDLEVYRKKVDADPVRLAAMVEEQKRWQDLYGPGGKLGIVDEKMVFLPKRTT